MKKSTYEAEAGIEESHWWFVGRRGLFETILSEHEISVDDTILDVGTSTGTNLRLLKDHGFRNYQGVDLSDDAIRWCAKKELGNVIKGDVCNLPCEDGYYRLVFATDVIEHVDDDLQALKELKRILREDGAAIITVPAFQSLWGLQDEVSHHKRRYLKKELQARISEAGMQCVEIYYFNYLLFLPIWMMRKLIKIFGMKIRSENQLNSPIINKILTHLFDFDIRTARRIHPPFGVSILAIVVK